MPFCLTRRPTRVRSRAPVAQRFDRPPTLDPLSSAPVTHTGGPDASRTDHPCSHTRFTSRARLNGQLRAFLCTSIWVPSCQPVRLRAFRLTKVARMDNPLQGTTSWHITPNSAAATDGNRHAGARSAVNFCVRWPRLSGKPLDGHYFRRADTAFASSFGVAPAAMSERTRRSTLTLGSPASSNSRPWLP